MLDILEHENCAREIKRYKEKLENSKEIISKLIQVMQGWDYRSNNNFSLMDCVEVETDARVCIALSDELLKGDDKQNESAG